MTTPPADAEYLTTKEAAHLARCAVVTVHRHALAGTLQSISAGRGRGRKYRREWVREWMARDAAPPKRAAS